MSDNKKYYYLKLKENFFDREEIKVIKGMEKGDTYICIMLELYLRSLKRKGSLMMTDRIPYSLSTLSSVLSRSQDEVKYAIELFKEFQLIDVFSNGEIFMSEIQNFIGHSSTEADRKRLTYNSINTRILKDSGEISEKSPPEIEIEIEKELKLEIKKDINIKRKANIAFVFEDFTEQEENAIKTWLEYKAHRKQSYKSQHGYTALRNELLELKKTQSIVECINYSMAKNWAGIFAIKKDASIKQSTSEALHRCNSLDFSINDF